MFNIAAVAAAAVAAAASAATAAAATSAEEDVIPEGPGVVELPLPLLVYWLRLKGKELLEQKEAEESSLDALELLLAGF